MACCCPLFHLCGQILCGEESGKDGDEIKMAIGIGGKIFFGDGDDF